MAENVQSFHGPLSERVRAQVVACCAQRQGRLLDIGCGNGLLFDALKQYPALCCFGVDRSLELLTAVRQRHRDIGCTNGMMDRLPFRDGAFQTVTCLNTLLNLPSIDVVRIALNEMMRISADRVIVDIRNGDNPCMRFKYWLHSRNANFPTVAYRLNDIDRIFKANGFYIAQAYSIGVDLRPLALGYVVEGVRG